jgi:glutamyl-tRNA synthetase
MPATAGRLAPSPTGAQHVGNARTYLVAWLSARSRGGRVALRMEDIDSPRVKPGAAEEACADLRWLGLSWDEGPIFQTARLPLYEDALEELKKRELVYPCTCTRSDVERAASAPHFEHEGPAYPGTCASRRAADAASLASRSFSWRFRVGSEPIGYNDALLGAIRVAPGAGGDFVVWKSVGTPAYQLAVVVDDAAQGITEVIRGDDLVPSTPRQILLYRALNLSQPTFAHIPLVVGPDGRRLAKRHGDTRLAILRAGGVAAEGLLGLLAWSCGWIDRPGPMTPKDLLPLFRLETIPRNAFVLERKMLEEIGFAP